MDELVEARSLIQDHQICFMTENPGHLPPFSCFWSKIEKTAKIASIIRCDHSDVIYLSLRRQFSDLFPSDIHVILKTAGTLGETLFFSHLLKSPRRKSIY